MSVEPRDVNLWVSLTVSAFMLGMLGYAHLFKRPVSLVYKDFPSVTIAFMLLTATWLSAMTLYMILWSTGYQPQEGVSPPIAVLFLNNATNVFTIAAAYVYARGEGFDKKRLFAGMGFLFLGLVIWEVLAKSAVSKLGLVGQAVAIAPAVAVSTIALVGLGLSCFARWGGICGTTFLIVMVGYALLQLPAFLVMTFPAIAPSREVTGLVFALLAAGKIPWAYGAIAFLTASAHPDVKAKEAVTWNSVPVAVPPSFMKLGAWITTLVGAIVAAGITEPIGGFLRRQLFGA